LNFTSYSTDSYILRIKGITMMIWSDLLNDTGQTTALDNSYINNLCLTYTIYLRQLSDLSSSNDEEPTSSFDELFW